MAGKLVEKLSDKQLLKNATKVAIKDINVRPFKAVNYYFYCCNFIGFYNKRLVNVTKSGF